MLASQISLDNDIEVSSKRPMGHDRMLQWVIYMQNFIDYLG